MKAAALLLVLATMLSACASPPSTPPAGTIPVEPPALAGVRYDCPPGPSQQRLEELCVGRLSAPTKAYTEPFVSLHPGRPEVIAVGVNALAPEASTGSPASARPASVEVFVSEDGGATWRSSRLPSEAAAAKLPRETSVFSESVDPALVFDDEGTLHATAIVSEFVHGDGECVAGCYWDVYYTASRDLGRTWSDPILLSTDGKSDRNWIAVADDGTLYVVYMRLWDVNAVQLLWSKDHGSTWERLPEPGVQPCRMASPPVVAVQSVRFGCVADFADAKGTLVQFDRASGFTQETVIDGAVHYPFIVGGGSDLLAVYSSSGKDIQLRRWTEDARVEHEPVPLRGILGVEDDWFWMRLRWVAADPWGGLHIVAEGGETVPCPRDPTCASEEARGHRALHAVLDRRSLSLLSERILTPDEPPEPTSSSLVPSGGSADDFFGLAFTAERGHLAWTFAQGIDYTRVERVLAP